MMGARTVRRLVAVLLLVLAVCSCSAGSTPGRPTPSPSTSSHAATTPVAESGYDALVGTWSSSEQTAEIVYRFAPDGRYSSVEILSWLEPDGVVEFRWVNSGNATVDGDGLHLEPTSSTESRTDPDDPGGDFTDRPASLDARDYRWRVGGDALHLRDASGVEIELDRQPA